MAGSRPCSHSHKNLHGRPSNHGVVATNRRQTFSASLRHALFRKAMPDLSSVRSSMPGVVVASAITSGVPSAAQPAPSHEKASYPDVPGAEGFPAGVYVHPSSAACVSPSAVLMPGVSIGPFCVVSAEATLHADVVLDGHNAVIGTTTIGEGTRLLHGAVVGARDGGGGTTVVGAHNTIGHHAAVGVVCQDLKYDQSTTGSHLVVGDCNDIREGASIQRSSLPDTTTRLGNSNLVMNHAHVGHDVTVGDGNVLASGVLLAGHVRVGSRCVIGGGVAIAQRCVVGDYAFLAGGSMVERDVPPCVKAMGDRAVTRGVNDIQLMRCGVSDDERAALRKAYRALWFAGGEGTSNAGETARRLVSESKFAEGTLARSFLEFVAEADNVELAKAVPRERVGAVCSGDVRARRSGAAAS